MIWPSAMDLLLEILLAAVLIGFTFKSLRRGVLRALGRSDKPIVLEVRIGAILFLLCTNVMAAIDYWYPLYLCTYHAAPDDRYGMAMSAALPFWFLGAGISAWALFHVIRAIFHRDRIFVNILYATFGLALALGGFYPLLVLGCRLPIFAKTD